MASKNNYSLLAIESSGNFGGAALFQAGKILHEILIPEARAHAQFLIPTLDQLFQASQFDPQKLDAIAVNCGPGSYTGLRVGIASAQALGFAYQTPVFGVPCLDALCEEALQQGLFKQDCTILAGLDARHGQFVCALFSYQAGEIQRLKEDRLISPQELTDFAPKESLLLGNFIKSYEQDLQLDLFNPLAELDFPSPSSVGLSAQRLFQNRLSQAGQIKPVALRYFRPVQAQTIAERQASLRASSTQKPQKGTEA